MSIQLVTYANQTVTPTNDAIIYEKAVDQNGIFYGCNVTVTSNNVNITGGYGIVCGREFVINSESIAVTLAPSGTLDGRLYVRLDLADADAPIQLLTATGNTLPPLVQDDDVNYTNGTYEMELATFTVGVSSLSDVVETFEGIKGTNTKILTLLEKEESKTLLWTNPSPSSVMSQTQIVDSGADGYDYIEVIYKTAHIYNGYLTARAPYISGGHITLLAPSGSNGEFTGSIVNAIRTITMSDGKLIADSGGTFNTSGFSSNNNMCIPVKVFGVKLGGG